MFDISLDCFIQRNSENYMCVGFNVANVIDDVHTIFDTYALVEIMYQSYQNSHRRSKMKRK